MLYCNWPHVQLLKIVFTLYENCLYVVFYDDCLHVVHVFYDDYLNVVFYDDCLYVVLYDVYICMLCCMVMIVCMLCLTMITVCMLCCIMMLVCYVVFYEIVCTLCFIVIGCLFDIWRLSACCIIWCWLCYVVLHDDCLYTFVVLWLSLYCVVWWVYVWLYNNYLFLVLYDDCVFPRYFKFSWMSSHTYPVYFYHEYLPLVHCVVWTVWWMSVHCYCML